MKIQTIRTIGAALVVGFMALAAFYSPAHAGEKFGISMTLPLDVNLWRSHGTVTIYAETYDEDIYSIIDNSVVNNTDNSVNHSNNGNSTRNTDIDVSVRNTDRSVTNHTNMTSINQTSISSHQHNNVHVNGIGNDVNIGR